MKFENVQVMNFENAFRGLRNPLESWQKSDSKFGLVDIDSDFLLSDTVSYLWAKNENKIREKNGLLPYDEDSNDFFDLQDKYDIWLYEQGVLKQKDVLCEVALIGPNDLKLAQRMIKAGSSDRKFLRQIMVSVDLTAPLYWQNSFCQ